MNKYRVNKIRVTSAVTMIPKMHNMLSYVLPIPPNHSPIVNGSQYDVYIYMKKEMISIIKPCLCCHYFVVLPV